MKTPTHPRFIIIAGICCLALLLSLPARAANITKAGSGTDLTDGASWNGSVAPAAGDVAVWDTGSLGAGLTLNSGAPGWLGLTVSAGATDPVNIGSGGTLTLGTSGVNMSAATINATLGCDLSLASGYQSWLVASGRTLAINGALTPAAGASMSFPTNGVTSTSPTLTNDSTGILPAWATVTGTADWATTNGAGNVTNYTGYTSVTATVAPNAAQNWKTTGNTTVSTSGTINSANVVGGDLIVGANTLTLGSGGLILGSTERWVPGTTGTIKSGLATGELYIHANTATFANGFQIQPKIIDGLTSTIVTKDGSGQVEMGNGASTFSGGFYLNAGSVYLGASSTGSGGAPSQGPLGTGLVTLNGGALFPYGRNNGSSSVYAGFTLANNINIPAGASATINNGGLTAILSGNISGVVPTFLGAGITALQGANSYVGNTTITVGTLGTGNANGANNNLSSGDVTIYTNGTLRVGYSTVNTYRTYTANNITLAGGNLYAEDAWQYLTGNINVTSNSILGSTYNNAGTEQDKGLFICGVLSGSAALTVQHSRINTANSSFITSFVAFTNNANTYSGTITINENTTGNQGGVYLGVNGSTALANATINVPGPVVGLNPKFGSSPLVFSSGLGGSATLGALTGSGPVVLSGYDEVGHAYSGNIALTVGANNSSTTYSGVLSGGGGLIKAGSGTFTLGGTNTFTGSTAISAGGLTIGGAGKLGSGNYYGAIVNNGSLTYSSSAAQALFGPISGSGSLTNNGAGVLTLAGSQSSSQNNLVVNDGATLNEAFSPAAQLTATSLKVGTTTGASLGFVANSTSVARYVAGTLTLNGTATINILGGNLVAGNSYPLITYTTGGGSYTLGTVPGGVAGNLSTSANTIYFNVTGVTNTIWTGAVNGTWDINTTPNWTNAAAGNTYLAGSAVQFDDTGLNTTTISNSVATTLSPISVLVTNNTKAYAFLTNTIIAGSASLTKTGTANLTNATPNTYTGPTIINQGAVVAGVASVANVSGALGLNSAVTLGNDATAVLNLNGFSTQIGSLAGGGTTGGNVALGSGTLTVGADNSTTTYAGAVSGSGGLTKIGAGTLTLNNTNNYTGATTVSAGQLVLTGNATVPSVTSGFLVGNVGGSSAAVYQSGVNTAVSAQPTGGGWQLGSTAGAYGYYKLTAGSMNVTNGGEFDPGGSAGGAGTFGQFDMSGGTLNIGWTNGTGSSYFLPNRGGVGESSVVNISGGTVNINSNMIENAAFAGFEVNWAAGNQTNTTTISGSAVFTSPSVSVKLNQANNAANVCSLNLNGGLFQTLGFTAARNASAVVNFNGGTLKAGNSASPSFFGNVASVYSYANGGTIDNNGMAISIATTLSSPTGNGAASIAVGTAGSGYIVPPQVAITGDGTGATAYSTIDPVSGAVTGIIVTCPGTGYSTASASLAGGGGSGATAGAVTLAANTSGPLRFTGAGTTTLSNAYYVTGGISVLGGVLAMNTQNGIPSPGGNLVVSNATLALDASGGNALPANNVTVGSTLNLTMSSYANAISGTGNMTLGDNTTNNLVYGLLGSAPTAAALKVTGTLTKGTNIVFNISATGLQPNWVVPLVEADSTAMTTNNFVLGSLPSGIKAVLTNDATYPNTISMRVISAGQLLTWRGASADGSILYPNWNINTDTNWINTLNTADQVKYLQYLGNTIGDNVIFGDSGYNTIGTNSVNLSVAVVPATVTFSATTPYTLTGAGGIGGETSVVLTNETSSVYLGTANTYTGGTAVSGGTLIITNDNALGNVSGGVVLGGGSLQLNGSVASSRALTITANSAVGVGAGNSASLSGTISGTSSLTKTDNGTLTIAGNNTYAGQTLVSGGIVNLTGTNGPGSTIVGTVSGNTRLNISGTSSLTASNLFVGNASGSFAAVNQTGGSVTSTNGGGDCMAVGNINGAFGYYNAAGGTMRVNGIAVGGENNTGTGFNGATTGGNGILDINGGTVNNIGWLVMARSQVDAGGETGILNVFSGSLTFAGGGLVCNWGTNETSIINVMGGSVTSTNTGFGLGATDRNNIGILNLNGGVAGGTVVGGNFGGTFGVLNFNGGTLKSAASSSDFVKVTRANVYANGATIDDGGYTVTVNQPLLAPVGYGVNNITVGDGGSGYVIPPIVTLSGGVGSNATAIATISGGAVTAITVTGRGNGYDSSDTLSVTFAGGGASVVAPAGCTVGLTANTSGGLTKKGAGTLTLTGANTYTGLTVVTNGGELLLTPAHQAGGAVLVADTAKFGVTASSVSNSATIGALTLGSSGATTLDFICGFIGNPTNQALTAGAVTINGTCTIHIGGSFALGTFPVLKYASLSGAFNPTVSAPRGMAASVINDTVNKLIKINVTSLASPIVWTGTSPLPGKTNLWDLNTTTNWLIGVDPTTYQETTPPGDAVLFTDSGTSLVLLSNTASPASMTISNNSVAYTIQGPGQISGVGGVTKIGSGTAALTFANNNYSGATVVSNGTLVASGGGAIGDASAVTLADVASASLVITNGETIGSLAGGGTTGGNVAFVGTLNMGGNNAATTFGGNIISADSELNKLGTGSIGLGGTVDVGQFNVDNSTVNVTGTLIANGSAGSRIRVGRNAGNATMNIPSGATVTAYNSIPVGSDTSTGTLNVNGGTVIHTNALGFYLGSGNAGSTGYLNLNSGVISNYSTAYMYIGESGSSVGVYKQTGGIASLGNIYVGQSANTNQLNILGGTATAGTVSVGYAATGQGKVIVSNASLSVDAMNIAQSTAATHADQGTVIVDNGTLNSENDLVVGLGGSSANGSFGTLLITNGGIVNVASTVKRWLQVSRYDTVTSTLTIDGGTLNLNENTDIRFSANGGTGVGVINLNSGAITCYSTNQTGAGSSGVLDFNRGANGGSVNNTFNLNGGTLTIGGIDSFYTSGTRVFNFNGGTLKPTASSTAFFAANEASAANVLATGAKIDTAGYDITIGQALINNGVDEDGGLTKNGNGTLTLNGINTYTNVTTVNAGLLGGTGTIAGRVVVNANAGLAPGSAGIGTLTINSNITLNALSTNVFEVNGTTPASDRVAAGASVTYGGVLKIVPTGNFTVGQQFQLFSGAGATNTGNFASVQSTAAGTAFSFTNGILSVTAAGPTGSNQLTNSVTGGGTTLSLSWGAGWKLQMQTNSLTTGLGTNWTYITDGTLTSTNLTIDATKPTVFYRLVYP